MMSLARGQTIYDPSEGSAENILTTTTSATAYIYIYIIYMCVHLPRYLL